MQVRLLAYWYGESHLATIIEALDLLVRMELVVDATVGDSPV